MLNFAPMRVSLCALWRERGGRKRGREERERETGAALQPTGQDSKKEKKKPHHLRRERERETLPVALETRTSSTRLCAFFTREILKCVSVYCHRKETKKGRGAPKSQICPLSLPLLRTGPFFWSSDQQQWTASPPGSLSWSSAGRTRGGTVASPSQRTPCLLSLLDSVYSAGVEVVVSVEVRRGVCLVG